MKSPLVTRKTYEKEQREHQSTKYRLADAERKIKELESEILPRVKAAADKVAKIEWSRHRPPSHRYCLTIEFDERQKSDTAADGVANTTDDHRRLSAFFLFSFV